jgi:hypothetical protein
MPEDTTNTTTNGTDDNDENSTNANDNTGTRRRQTDNPRPIFELARQQATSDQIRIFALVIGINDYQGSISKLSGCIKDAHNIANYLRRNYGGEETNLHPLNPELENDPLEVEVSGQLHLCLLKDEQATYGNIIRAFEEHLINDKATGNDTFLFHFSGHGSEQFTAEEFFAPKDKEGKDLTSLVPNGKDQTLACYNPGGSQEGIFLADKELAYLIHQLHDRVRSKKQRPHIIITLDCCHSGTGTRDVNEPPGFKTRNHTFLTTGDRTTGIELGQSRAFDTYYGHEKFYGPQKENGKLYVPTAPHLLIAACSNLEKAGDMFDGGVLTSSLMDVLNEAEASEDEASQTLNYATLFSRVRNRARAKRKKQTPQFEPIAGFNPYTAFLEGWKLGDSQQYSVLPRGRHWYVGCGAIHGIPSQSTETDAHVMVQVFKADGHELLGNAFITKVGLQDSRLELLDDLKDKLIKRENIESQVDESEEPYVAEIFTLPAPAQFIWLNKQADTPEANAAFDGLMQKWNTKINDQDVLLDNLNIKATDQLNADTPAEVEVRIDETGHYILYNRLNGKEWFDLVVDEENALGQDSVVALIKSGINMIVRWKRFIKLDNPKSKLKDDFDLAFLSIDHDTYIEEGSPHPNNKRAAFLKAMHVSTANEIKCYGSKESLFSQDNFGMEKDTLVFVFRLKNHTANRFYYFFSAEENTAINWWGGEPHLEKPTEEEGLILERTIKSAEGSEKFQLQQMRLSDTGHEGTFWFKLLVTKKPVQNIASLTQDGFPLSKSADLGGFKVPEDMEDWEFKTIKVSLIRQLGAINENRALKLADEQLIIHPHPSLNAQVSIVSSEENNSLDPTGNLAQLGQREGVQMLSFSTPHNNGRQNILELTEMNIEEEVDLKDQPLRISIKGQLQDGEVLVPAAFDGQFFKIIGTAKNSASSGDQINVSIHKLPALQVENGGTEEQIAHPFHDTQVDASLFQALKIGFFKIQLF